MTYFGKKRREGFGKNMAFLPVLANLCGKDESACNEF